MLQTLNTGIEGILIILGGHREGRHQLSEGIPPHNHRKPSSCLRVSNVAQQVHLEPIARGRDSKFSWSAGLLISALFWGETDGDAVFPVAARFIGVRPDPLFPRLSLCRPRGSCGFEGGHRARMRMSQSDLTDHRRLAVAEACQTDFDVPGSF